MSTLFVDTSYNQILGLLSPEGGLLGLAIAEGQKTSAALHLDLHHLCQAHGIAPSLIRHVVFVAGPGFYTGLRLAYGIADIIKLSGAHVSGFYTYDVPHLLGVGNYLWITKAYRGEVFVFSRAGTETKISLMTDREFLATEWPAGAYIHHPNALDEAMRAKLANPVSTQALLQQHLPAICAGVHAKQWNQELFYFRTAEEEFKQNP